MILFSLVYYNMKSILHYSHKKRKDSLATWAEQAVFFITWVPKIIRNQSTRAYMKYKQFKVKGLSSCFVLNLRMPGENCLIFNWHSSRAAPGVSFFGVPIKDNKYYYCTTLQKQHCCKYYSWYGDEDNLKRQIKTQTFWVVLSSRKHDLS